MTGAAITVLMPVYNAEKYLHEAIGSVLSQTFEKFEFLIINDGSTDSSEEIILSYTDTRIRYIKNETNIRLIATLNRGLDLCTGKYVVRMDADDISAPDRLQLQFDFMEQHPDVAMCGSWFELFGDRQGIVKYAADHNRIMMKMLYQCHFCHPSVILRKAMIQTMKPWFDASYIHAEDYEFFSRIGEKYKVANIQQVLLSYRCHAGSVSEQNRNTQIHNSTLIKKRMFSKMGLNASEADLQLYQSIEQHEYVKSMEYLLQCRSLLEKMYVANNNSNYFSQPFLQQYLAQLWLNVAYNSTSLGSVVVKTYTSSILATYSQPGLAWMVKLRVKAFFKI